MYVSMYVHVYADGDLKSRSWKPTLLGQGMYACMYMYMQMEVKLRSEIEELEADAGESRYVCM